MTTVTAQPFWRTDPPEMSETGAVLVGGMFPHQREWWELPNFVRLFVAGLGAGKTNLLCKRAIALALLNAPAPGAIVSPTFPMARGTVIETLMELLDGKVSLFGGDFAWDYHGTSHTFRLHHKDGGETRCGRIVILSGEHPQRLKGFNLAWCGIDEPFIQDEMVFKQMVARVRHPKAVRREINLTGCVSRDTIVLTPTGFRTIGSMDPGTKAKQYSVLGEMVFGDQGFHLAEKFYNNGADNVVRLTLAKGFEVVCTPDHPVMVMGEDLEPVYKRVGSRTGKYGHLPQLDPENDRVAVARGMEVWGGDAPQDVTPDDAYGLGVWVAEGSLAIDQARLTVTCGDDTVLSFFRGRGLFGECFRNKSVRSDQVRLYSRALVDRMRGLDMPLVKAPQKWLPAWVMGGGTRELALHFLAGMYDGDGHVCADGTAIGYTTTSRLLARQLQALLTNVGVCADLVRNDTPPTERVKVWSERWQVLAMGQNAERLAEMLPLRIPRKRAALGLYRRRLRDSDCIPNVGAAILRLWGSARRGRWRVVPEGIPNGYRICESIRQSGGQHVSYSRVDAFCQLWRLNERTAPPEIAKLESLVRSWFYWAQVRRVQDDGVTETVDFVIPETHSFTPNGIVSLQTPEQLNWGYELAEGEMRANFDVGIVRASSTDNLALPENYGEHLRGGFDDERAQAAYIHGHFVNLSRGQVYYGFDHERNVVTMPLPEGAELGCGMDFNVNPMAFVVFYHDRRMKRIHVVREFELPNSDTPDACVALREAFGSKGLRDVYPDPSGKSRRTSAPAGVTDFDHLRRAGYSVHATSQAPAVRDRYNRVNSMLKDGTLTIAPECKRLKRYLSTYTHEDKNTEAHKAMSHLLDALGYGVCYLYPPVSRALHSTRVG